MRAFPLFLQYAPVSSRLRLQAQRLLFYIPFLFTLILYHDIYILQAFFIAFLHFFWRLKASFFMSFFLPYIIYRHFFLFWRLFQHIYNIWNGFPFFAFCSRIVNISPRIFVSTPYFCIQIVNNLQNTKYTKYKIFRSHVWS